jgi:hypothetical protein
MAIIIRPEGGPISDLAVNSIFHSASIERKYAPSSHQPNWPKQNRKRTNGVLNAIKLRHQNINVMLRYLSAVLLSLSLRLGRIGPQLADLVSRRNYSASSKNMNTIA